MSGVKKKISVVKFIAISTTLFFAMAIIGMSALIIFTTHKATESVVVSRLRKESGRVSRNIEIIEDGDIEFSYDYENGTDGCYAVVITKDGTVLEGEYPDDMSAAATVGVTSKRKLMRIETENGIYCYFDRPLKSSRDDKEYTSDVFIRVIIKYREINTIYQDIQKLLYIYIFLLVAIMSVGGYLLYRKVAHQVNAMCDQIKSITESLNLSERIENTGAFKETEIITNVSNKLIEQAEKQVLQQEEFNQNISHELRTPITLIQGECELLEDIYGNDMPEAVIEAVSVIHKQSDRMNNMISELLYLAQLNRENYILHKETVDLLDIVESACDDAEDLADGSHEFVRDLYAAETEVDVGLFMIAVRNLISNAIKYSPYGSKVYVSSGTEGDEVFVSIRDEGYGISEENQKRIFKPYYQVNNERNSEGFGLGLNLAERIVEKHGGSIKLTSTLNEGSTFTIVLPVRGDSNESS